MSKFDLDNETREIIELKIEEVEHCNEELTSANRIITSTSIAIGVVALYTAYCVVRGVPFEFPWMYGHIGMTSAFIGSAVPLVFNIIKKIGIKANIEEIRVFIESQGLSFEDEVSKGKGM